MSNARRSLIFDLDGTLIDSAPDIAGAMNALLAELDQPALSLEQVRRLVGDGAPTLLARALTEAGARFAPESYDTLLDRYRALYLARATEKTKVYPGVPETLARLREAGYRMVVCTNKIQRPTLAILDTLDLAGYFDGVAGGDVVPARKPDPAHLLAGLKLVGSAPEEAVMIGDGINDVAAARAAGIPVLVLPSGYGEIAAAELGGDRLLQDFGEIPAALGALGA
jgi:phosphoglycolate phosphatase